MSFVFLYPISPKTVIGAWISSFIFSASSYSAFAAESIRICAFLGKLDSMGKAHASKLHRATDIVDLYLVCIFIRIFSGCLTWSILLWIEPALLFTENAEISTVMERSQMAQVYTLSIPFCLPIVKNVVTDQQTGGPRALSLSKRISQVYF